MQNVKKLIQVLIVLAGCGCLCVAGVLAFLHAPDVLKSGDVANLIPLGGYLVLAAAGIGLMLAAKRLSD